MNNPFDNKKWYGRLGSKDGTVLIYDPQIPASSSKGVCLYNTDRNRFVEYITEIVRPNLLAIKGDELKAVKQQHDKAFKQAKSEFFSRSNLSTTVSPKTKPVVTNNDSSSFVDDSEAEDFDLLFEDD